MKPTAALARRWPLLALAILALALTLRGQGYLASFEHRAADARSLLLQHVVQSDIVIVGIDARSLADLHRWPWPRRYHARLLERLAEAKPRRIFMDVDFSAQTNAEDDSRFEAALAAFDKSPVILPTFFQPGTGADNALNLVSTPLESLGRHVTLGGVNWQHDDDGLVRTIHTSWQVGGNTVPAAVALIAAAALPEAETAPIDFSISPASFEFISYVDLLAGRVSAADLANKTVLIGGTALELGDMLPVPVYQSKPGIVVQALAAQSLREGALRMLPGWTNALVLAALAVFGALFFGAHAWRRNLWVLGGSAATIAAIDIYAYASHRLMLEVVPALLVLATAFFVATLRSLDEQTLRAISYALGIKRRDALLSSIVESSTDCIVCIDSSGRIETANPAGARLFGCDLSTLISLPLSRFVPALAAGNDSRAVLDELCGRICEQQALRLDGTAFPVEFSVSPVHEQESLYTVMVRDISERKAQERKLRFQAMHDPLTSLPNRTALQSHLDIVLANTRPDRSVALLMLDLCRFKEVNDTLGHNIGDQVLCEVARRFESVVGGGFVARVGGDEFTMVLDGIANRDVIAQLARTLSDALRVPINTAGVAIDVGVSIGIALSPQDAPDAETLLRHADVAMYVAKRRNSPCEFYDPAYDEHTVRRLTMVSQLRAAITSGQLSLYYQPQVNLRTGRAESVEALLRWKHPDYGMVSPAEFIGVAESTDLIRPLTEWTIVQALTQAAAWREIGFEPRIAVNLSARLLQDVDFPETLRALLETHRARPEMLELEITESAMMQDTERALRVIREIHELGTFMSVDDFGTGFSSLGYLRDLPVHALKVDKSFVLNLRERPDDRVIVDSTVQMAHALGLQVVAEGVETEWVARYLANAGYDYAQGYKYSPAKPAHECMLWMNTFNGESHHGESQLNPAWPAARAAS